MEDGYIEGSQELNLPTPMDQFRQKVISELGYNNLPKVLALFEEFKTIAK